MREKAESSIINKLETYNFAKMYSINNTLIACYDIDIYEFSSSRNSKLIRLFFLFPCFRIPTTCTMHAKGATEIRGLLQEVPKNHSGYRKRKSNCEPE